MKLEMIEKYLAAAYSIENYMMPEDFSFENHRSFEYASVCARKVYIMLLEHFRKEYFGAYKDYSLNALTDRRDSGRADMPQLGAAIGDLIDDILVNLGWEIRSYETEMSESEDIGAEYFYEGLSADGMADGMLGCIGRMGVYEELFSMQYYGCSQVKIKTYTCKEISKALFQHYSVSGYIYPDDEIGRLVSQFENINECGLLSNCVFWIDGDLYFITAFMEVLSEESGVVIDIYEYYSNPTIPFLAAKIRQLLKNKHRS